MTVNIAYFINYEYICAYKIVNIKYLTTEPYTSTYKIVNIACFIYFFCLLSIRDLILSDKKYDK